MESTGEVQECRNPLHDKLANLIEETITEKEAELNPHIGAISYVCVEDEGKGVHLLCCGANIGDIMMTSIVENLFERLAMGTDRSKADIALALALQFKFEEQEAKEKLQPTDVH